VSAGGCRPTPHFADGSNLAGQRQHRLGCHRHSGVLSIGGDPLYGQYFSGRIDDVRIYNRALTQAQIQTDKATSIA
jgi:hypothetical protein